LLLRLFSHESIIPDSLESSIIDIMKTMTCNQLGGACDKEFKAETFEEMAEQSKQHGMEMYQQNDEAHLKAMEQMNELMVDPEAMKKWMEDKQREFDALPEDN
jgi:hypothetical protein